MILLLMQRYWQLEKPPENGIIRLHGCDLWVTLEPCAMCAGASAQARIRRLYIGALDDKSGGVFHGAKVFDHKQCHHRPDIYDGLMADASADMLKQFFAGRR